MESNKDIYPFWDEGTYFTRDLFEEVTQTGDLRKVWSAFIRTKGGRNKTLSVDDIHNLCTDTCPICKNELDYGRGHNNHNKEDKNTPSLDKIIPGEVGGQYVLDNVWVICERCNRFKNSAYGEEDAKRFEVLSKVLRDPKSINNLRNN